VILQVTCAAAPDRAGGCSAVMLPFRRTCAQRPRGGRTAADPVSAWKNSLIRLFTGSGRVGEEEKDVKSDWRSNG
jgi:hypothetical protein